MSTTVAAAQPDAPTRSHGHLRGVGSDQPINLAAAERAVRELLVALGRDPDTEHLRDTPRRVAAAYAELLTAEPFELTTFANDEGYDELVLARDIPFQLRAEHRVLRPGNTMGSGRGQRRPRRCQVHRLLAQRWVIVAGMSANVSDVTDTIEQLVRAGVAVNPDQVADPDSPLTSLTSVQAGA